MLALATLIVGVALGYFGRPYIDRWIDSD